MSLQCCFLLEYSWINNLGTEYLITVLRNHGYSVNVLFDKLASKAWQIPTRNLGKDPPLLQYFDNHAVDILFFSVNTDFYQRALSLANAIKKKKPHINICFGGPHPTYAHKYVLKNSSIDFICRGEGEMAIIELLEFIEHKRTALPAGIYRIKNNKIEGEKFGRVAEDINKIPFPDKSDFYELRPSAKKIYSLISGRGCFYNCSYCNSPVLRDYYKRDGQLYFRRRSVENVLSELKHAKQLYQPQLILFKDDTFLYNKKWLSDFASRYGSEINIPFQCLANPNFINEDVLRQLINAGLILVNCGIQSLNSKIRRTIFKRRESNHIIIRFFHLMSRLRLYTQVDHIINPWDKRDDLIKQAYLYNRLRPSWINVFYLTWYPEVSILNLAKDTGIINKEDNDKIYNGLLSKNYFMGGNLTIQKKSLSADISMFLTFIPLLPQSLVYFILNRKLVSIFKYLPWPIVLFARFFNALFRKADFIGREHIKNIFR